MSLTEVGPCVNMLKITKNHNLRRIFQSLLKSSSGRLLIAANLFLKFQASSFNSFEIFCWQDFIQFFFQRAITQERGIILIRNKYMSAILSWRIYIWNFKIIACRVHKLCYASKSVTHGRTNEPEAICPSNFFEVGGIVMESGNQVRFYSKNFICTVFFFLFFLFVCLLFFFNDGRQM